MGVDFTDSHHTRMRPQWEEKAVGEGGPSEGKAIGKKRGWDNQGRQNLPWLVD